MKRFLTALSAVILLLTLVSCTAQEEKKDNSELYQTLYKKTKAETLETLKLTSDNFEEDELGRLKLKEKETFLDVRYDVYLLFDLYNDGNPFYGFQYEAVYEGKREDALTAFKETVSALVKEYADPDTYSGSEGKYLDSKSPSKYLAGENTRLFETWYLGEDDYFGTAVNDQLDASIKNVGDDVTVVTVSRQLQKNMNPK